MAPMKIIEPITPGRNVFYIDVGDMKPEEALAYIEKVRAEYLKEKTARAGQLPR
jgi:hypothetical protein